ncbi:MAG: SUMF1/EgtB/PvdO family nonheme iron enzyme [Cyanobacteria bacterium]|nr:SUMF1/EgtB/PvdO family nonheme iron enzyme [Cyanobacteriota bacterium]
MGSRHYAIVVGINQYSHGQISNLNYAERDALELYGAMCRAGFEHVDLITHFSHRLNDDRVRLGSLSHYIDEVIPTYQLNPDDVIWFFFAGHGKRTEDPNQEGCWEDYLLPHDAGIQVGRTWIKVQDVVRRLRETGASNIILCLDACRDSDGGRGFGDGGLQGNYEGVVTLFACDKDQKSYEIDHEKVRHGAFTYALLKAMDRKDAYPTIRELSDYLCQKVPQLCREYGKPDQRPMVQVEGDLLWQLPALPNVQSSPQLPDLTELVQRARRAERAAFDLFKNQYNLERLEIAKAYWWQVLEANPAHEEARQEVEGIIQRITRITLEEGLQKKTIEDIRKEEKEAVRKKSIAAAMKIRSRKIQPLPKPPDPFDGWDLKEWCFETVRVDAKGQVVERLQKTARSHFVDLGEGVSLELVAVPGGQFQMGSPDTEAGRDGGEEPVRTVTVPPLLVGRYPVTVAQWRRVAGDFPAVLNPQLKADPSNWKDLGGPVERVNWFDALEFCARLATATGKTYRLPTEAEWEYACRGGTKTPFAFGETLTTGLANYDGNSTYANGPKGEYRQRTSPVGQFPANGFGLQDVHGNVWEWCLDDWHNTYTNAPSHSEAWLDKNNHSQAFCETIKLEGYLESFFKALGSTKKSQEKLLRGGSWSDDPLGCRCAARLGWGAGDIFNSFGFRVVLLP